MARKFIRDDENTKLGLAARGMEVSASPDEAVAWVIRRGVPVETEGFKVALKRCTRRGVHHCIEHASWVDVEDLMGYLRRVGRQFPSEVQEDIISSALARRAQRQRAELFATVAAVEQTLRSHPIARLAAGSGHDVENLSETLVAAAAGMPDPTPKAASWMPDGTLMEPVEDEAEMADRRDRIVAFLDLALRLPVELRLYLFSVAESNMRWNINDEPVHVKDTVNKWYKSTIVARNDTGQVLIHYWGWAKKWNEWINEASDRIQPWVEPEDRVEQMVVGEEATVSDALIGEYELFVDSGAAQSALVAVGVAESISGGLDDLMLRFMAAREVIGAWLFPSFVDEASEDPETIQALADRFRNRFPTRQALHEMIAVIRPRLQSNALDNTTSTRIFEIPDTALQNLGLDVPNDESSPLERALDAAEEALRAVDLTVEVMRAVRRLVEGLVQESVSSEADGTLPRPRLLSGVLQLAVQAVLELAPDEATQDARATAALLADHLPRAWARLAPVYTISCLGDL